MLALFDELIPDFCEGLLGRLSCQLEHRVQVLILPRAHDGDQPAELVVAELPRMIRVIFVKEGLDFLLAEDAAKLGKSLSELPDINSALVLEVEVLERFADGLPLVVLGDCLLPYLLK